MSAEQLQGWVSIIAGVTGLVWALRSLLRDLRQGAKAGDIQRQARRVEASWRPEWTTLPPPGMESSVGSNTPTPKERRR